MPGRTATEAVNVFLEPFAQALRLLNGHARVTVSPRPPYRKGDTYRWSLNGESGMALPQVGTFYASMNFAVIDSDPTEHDEDHQGGYRCTSRSYNYKLATPRGADLWRLHWHPDGPSPVKAPHVHLPPDLDRHLPTGRISFEKAVMWLVEFDAPLRVDRDEAVRRLLELEAPHLLYRSWSQNPGEARR